MCRCNDLDDEKEAVHKLQEKAAGALGTDTGPSETRSQIECVKKMESTIASNVVGKARIKTYQDLELTLGSGRAYSKESFDL